MPAMMMEIDMPYHVRTPLTDREREALRRWAAERRWENALVELDVSRGTLANAINGKPLTGRIKKKLRPTIAAAILDMPPPVPEGIGKRIEKHLKKIMDTYACSRDTAIYLYEKCGLKGADWLDS